MFMLKRRRPGALIALAGTLWLIVRQDWVSGFSTSVLLMIANPPVGMGRRCG
jgi:hypothetical protein